MKRPFIYFLPLFLVGLCTGQNLDSPFGEGLSLFSEKDYSSAYNKFKQYIVRNGENNPQTGSAQYYASECMYKMGDYPSAILEYERLIAYHRFSNLREEGLYKLGILYDHIGEYAKSLQRLITLINQYPGSPHGSEALRLIRDAFVAVNQLAEAQVFFEQLIAEKKHPGLLDYTIYNLAAVYEKQGGYQKASELYEYMLTYFKSSPLFHSAQTRLGYCYFYLNEYENSIIELSNPSLQSLPADNRAEALYMLGTSYYRTREFKQAASIFKDITVKFESSAYARLARYSLGWAFFQLERYDEAFELFDALSNQQTNDTITSLAFYWKAECKRYAGKDNEALRIFQDFIKKYPDNELGRNIQYQAAVIYYNNKLYDKAILFLGESIKNCDGEAKARSITLLGEIELNRRNFNKAQTCFSDAMSITPIPPDIRHRALLGRGVANFYLKAATDASRDFSDLSFEAPHFEKNKVNFFRGECEFLRGNYSTAIQYYSLVTKQDSLLYPPALYGLAYSHYNAQKYADAAFAFEDFLKVSTDAQKSQDARLRLADVYFVTKQYAGAAKQYDELLKSGKSSLNSEYLAFQFALAQYKAGKTQNAIAEFNRIVKAYPSTAQAENALYMIGWIAFQQSKYNDAIQSYRKVLAYNANSKYAPLVYYSIGDAFYNLALYDSALSYYGKVVEKFPSSPFLFDAVNGIQTCYSAQGKTQEALKNIDEFIAANPSSVFAEQLTCQRGDIYFNQGDYSQAIEQYQMFVRTYPTSKLVPKALFSTAKCLQFTAALPAALEFFKGVCEQYPNSKEAVPAVIEASKILTAGNDYAGAIALIEKSLSVLKTQESTPELLYYKGLNLAAKGDIPAAYDVFDEITLYHQASVFADKSKLELGIIELRAKRYPNAIKLFRALLANHNDEIGASAQYYSGLVFKEQGKLTDAITAFIRVVNGFGAYTDWCARSYYMVGECYEQMRNIPKAKVMYGTVKEKYPDSDTAPLALRKLEGLK